MPLKYSCFVSYRHTETRLNRSMIRRMVDALKAELELWVPKPVFLDEDRLKGGEFYKETLASELCQSACMVILYWPTYFSMEHTFCSREYQSMVQLETERLARLPDPLERQKGLIITLAIRDFKQVPAELRSRRNIHNFEAHSMRPSTTPFRNDVKNIGSYIAERCHILDATLDPCRKCDEWRLPEESAILPWIHQALHPAIPYPTREAGR